MGNAEDLEAMIRQAMREHLAIAPRGFDSQRKRADLHRQIDEMIDDWQLERLTEAS